MTTTIMRDSIVGDQWIRDTQARHPIQRLTNAEGKLTGNILSGPVRLSFAALFAPEAKMKSQADGAKDYHSTLLFPPGTDFAIIMEEYARVAASDFQQWPYNPATGSWPGLHMPLRSCNEKPNFAGYTPNCWFMKVSSNFKPPVVDHKLNPIVDPEQIYAGCWALVAFNTFAGGKGKPQKGPMFGIQSVMKIADDSRLGGGANPQDVFKGVSVTPPVIGGSAFGTSVPPAVAPPVGLPGGVGAFYPPSAPPSPAPAPAAPSPYAAPPPPPAPFAAPAPAGLPSWLR